MEKLYRQIAVLTILAFMLAMILTMTITVSLNAKTIDSLERTSYVVEQGDCLWTIAQNNCPPGVDMEAYILRITEINNLSNSTIYPGEILVILK